VTGSPDASRPPESELGETLSQPRPPTTIREGVVLDGYTSLRVGGQAHFFAEPTTVDGVADAIAWASEVQLSVVVLGAGTNTVFGDGGHSGLVLSARGLRGVRFEETQVVAAAGEPLARLAWSVCERGLSGLEWACGIPGSVGGAVVMNAGAGGSDVAAVLVSADVLSSGKRLTVPADSLGLGYRTSSLLTGDLRGVVVEAAFILNRDDPQTCLDRARSSIVERLNRLPVGASAGCVFRNPDTGPTAGELLDRAGCKELKVGHARVSEKHANVIVNEGVGNAKDVLELIDRMKSRVLDAFGVELREEVVIHP
jgi:UDP-N-acetylmuramate dehydrogenase